MVNFITYSSLLAASAILSTLSDVLVSAAPHCGLVSPTTTAIAVQQTSTSTNTKANSTGGEDVVATGWYPGWLGSQLAPSQISWSKYSALTFAFA